MELIRHSEVLKHYVEKSIVIDKATLLHRITGKVEYSLLQTMKLLQFNVIGKDSKDQLYLI